MGLSILTNALSLVIWVDENPLIKRFLKGIFRMTPSASKYSVTWDSRSVPIYLEQMPVTILKKIVLQICNPFALSNRSAFTNNILD